MQDNGSRKAAKSETKGSGKAGRKWKGSGEASEEVKSLHPYLVILVELT